MRKEVLLDLELLSQYASVNTVEEHQNHSKINEHPRFIIMGLIM